MWFEWLKIFRVRTLIWVPIDALLTLFQRAILALLTLPKSNFSTVDTLPKSNFSTVDTLPKSNFSFVDTLPKSNFLGNENKKDTFLVNFRNFLPPTFCKRCANNSKFSEILVLVKLQRINSNHEYNTIVTLTAHLQRVDLFNILRISSQIYSLRVTS